MSNGTIATTGQAGTVRPVDITSTMQEAYLDYAMSVIVSRALPDVRDGLKPVHRRILYAMFHDLGLTSNKPHKKSARIVGEVLGKYHPHGDTAVYDAMVRMAQDFSLRYPLVDGQGNFGSIDGDNAAAMRYTEARLAEISSLMLDDLEKDTVEWHENFDNTLREPDILPADLPNLLINGSSGIAVGMATNIPPHNLGEVVDALTYMLDRYDHLDDVTVEHLLQFIKGPDFPTGGILYRYREEKGSDDLDAITQGYSMGKARLILQAKAHFEEMSRNRSRIVVTELPYQTNKTALIERIASLVRDDKIEGITDLRDESDRTGMRIVIELTRNVEPKDILADLFKYTPLQQTFGMQMLALVDGQPRLLGLKRILQLFIQHRQEIIRRRSEYELARARERAHILEGLLKALDILDEVIATIRRSQTVETARNNLVKNFQFTLIQAQAILDMQLRRLAALERKRLQQEYDELLKRIAYLEDLLAHPEKVLAVIKEDMLAIKEKYADPRRTQIVDRTKGTLTTTDLLPEQDVWVTVGSDGILLRTDVARIDKRTVREVGKSSQVALLNANTRDFLYLFAHDGRTARIAIHEIPQDGGGKHYADLTEFSRRDGVHAAITVPRLDSSAGAGYLFFVTAQAMVKRITMADFLAAAAADPIVMNVDSKDRLAAVFATPGQQDVILVSSGGKSIRFNEDDVRSMGLAAGGVGGMKLKKGERIVYAGLVDPAGELATITASGYAKRSRLDDYATQGRNGGGIVTHKPTARTGVVSAARVLTAFELSQSSLNLALVTSKNKVAVLTLDEIPAMGRAVQGKQVMAVGMSDEVSVLHALGDAPDPAAGDENGAGAGPNAAGIGKNGSTTAAAGGASARNGTGHVKGKNQSRAPAARAASQPRAASAQMADRAKASPVTEASGKTSTRKSTSKSPVQPNAAASSTGKPNAAKTPKASATGKPNAAKPAAQPNAAASSTGKPNAAKTPKASATGKDASKPAAQPNAAASSTGKPNAAKTPKASATRKTASKSAKQPNAAASSTGKPRAAKTPKASATGLDASKPASTKSTTKSTTKQPAPKKAAPKKAASAQNAKLKAVASVTTSQATKKRK